jgi:HNH endonuclease/AP2 domain
MITYAELVDILSYEETSGKFVWRKKVGKGKHMVGDSAGCVKKCGYVHICVHGRKYQAHRLAWLYVHGKWPAAEIDHINGNPTDNRIVNLREATRSQNVANRRKVIRPAWMRGITWNKRERKWKAAIKVNQERIFIGTFDNAEEASRAYQVAAEKHFGEFLPPLE